MLLIEDHYEIRVTIEEILRHEGYRVVGVANGREALRALPHLPAPSLVLLDMMMPEMNGWEFLEARAERGRFCDYPVVVISALDGVHAMSGASSRLGAAGYLHKPIDIESLLATARRFCAAPAERQMPPPFEREDVLLASRSPVTLQAASRL